MRVLVLPCALLLCLLGCQEVRPDSSYSGSARQRYLEGVEALEDSEYLEATKHFTFVKNKFAYSKYAALAELRIADTYFEQDKLIEAIDAYRTFIQGRPNHREVPYAMWRIGLAHFEDLPSDFVLFPPPYEKDQAATRDAFRAFSRYVERFPEHEKVATAKEHIQTCRQGLADHELYVARFYLHRERPRSARGRLEALHRDYADVPGRWAAGTWLLAETLLQLDKPEEAVAAARALVAKQPDAEQADDARDFLARQR